MVIGTADFSQSMGHALRLARAAARRGEVPVGAIALHEGAVIATASNRIEAARDSAAHAEMLVLRRVSRILGGWRLTGVTVIVTLEPCPMCAGAMLQARIDRCVYGARDPRKGADGSAYDVLRHAAGNHRIDVVAGVRAQECSALLTSFFAARRQQARQDSRPAPA